MLIKVLMLLVFFASLIVVGIVCRKKATDVNSFVLGGRSVGPWLTAFAYGTSYFSAVIFIGYAGQFGWKFGVASTWIGIGNAILGSLLAWIVLGKRTRGMSQRLDSKTMPEFFAERFGSKNLRLVASVVLFIFMIPYTASLYNGLSRLFEMAFGVDYTVCIVVMSVLTAIYVIAGGYFATAINDFIQGIIMLVGIVAVVIAILNVNGGLSGSIDAMKLIQGDCDVVGKYASVGGPLPIDLIGVVILTSLGTWGLPQMVGKFYAIKDEANIKKGTIISTVFAVIVAGGCYFLGGFGRLFLTSEQVNELGFDAIIPKMLENLPDILIAIVVILVLSASMSTLSSLVLTSSSSLTLDFINIEIKKDMSEQQKVFVMRVFIFIFIAISAVIAVIQQNSKVNFIAQLMSISWGAMAGAFLAPFLFGLYSRKVSATACMVNFIFAPVLMLANMLFRSSFPTLLQSPINCGAFAMVFGIVIVPVISLFTKAPDDKFIKKSFGK